MNPERSAAGAQSPYAGMDDSRGKLSIISDRKGKPCHYGMVRREQPDEVRQKRRTAQMQPACRISLMRAPAKGFDVQDECLADTAQRPALYGRLKGG
jgi:hypothetical protein